MSCAKQYCPRGSENCCDECMYKLMEQCDDYCEKSKDAKHCVNYREEKAVEERKEKRKKKKRVQTLIMVLLLIAVFLLPAFALYQTWQTEKEVKELKKELPAATGQLRDPVQVKSNNHSITQKQEQRNGKYSTKHRTT